MTSIRTLPPFHQIPSTDRDSCMHSPRWSPVSIITQWLSATQRDATRRKTEQKCNVHRTHTTCGSGWLVGRRCFCRVALLVFCLRRTGRLKVIWSSLFVKISIISITSTNTGRPTIELYSNNRPIIRLDSLRSRKSEAWHILLHNVLQFFQRNIVRKACSLLFWRHLQVYRHKFAIFGTWRTSVCRRYFAWQLYTLCLTKFPPLNSCNFVTS